MAAERCTLLGRISGSRGAGSAVGPNWGGAWCGVGMPPSTKKPDQIRSSQKNSSSSNSALSSLICPCYTFQPRDMTASASAERPPCKRCMVNASVTTIRNEDLCHGCLISYVHSKANKRMETFRTRYGDRGPPRRLLVPVSFGCSSLALLHFLSGFVDNQLQRTNRASIALHVLHVDDSESTAAPSCVSRVQRLRERYPQHVYSTVPSHSIFSGDPPSENGIDSISSSLARLSTLLNALPSATAKSDVLSILLTRAIVLFAKASDCAGILWGHSTTRLGETVLSEAAKGRGFSVPWHVSDGPTPHGIPYHFPLRDLMKGEISEYLLAADEPLSTLAADPSTTAPRGAASAKNNSIDRLTQRFFETTEASHPGIVSNVVRTSGKLQHSVVGTRRCKLCVMPVTPDQLDIGGWAGVQGDGADAGRVESQLCYGCARSVPEEAVVLLP
jgi:cytoplasmic tRNA 2-thiolation protein 2